MDWALGYQAPPPAHSALHLAAFFDQPNSIEFLLTKVSALVQIFFLCRWLLFRDFSSFQCFMNFFLLILSVRAGCSRVEGNRKGSLPNAS
jgi:hypothetical protein